ncbi:hypothetical protein WKT22_04579 [Candidatus Lokiarchaeum ossiferum]
MGCIVKFRLVFETTTKHGNKVQLKFKVPPSKHLGLMNFLKIAMEGDEDIQFAVEKISEDKHDLSKAKGTFRLVQDDSEESITD